MSLLDTKYCYILDAALILYGFILTVLYCHLRMKGPREESKQTKKPVPEGGVYAGLNLRDADVYETIHLDQKKKAVPEA